MIKHILNVFNKEKMDTLRDRRTVMATFAYAVFGPLILVFALNFVADQTSNDTQTQLAVMGAENAPNLVHFLEGQGVEISVVEETSTPAASLGDAHVLLVINDDYHGALTTGIPATLWLYVDRTNSGNSSRANRIRRQITAFGEGISNARLLANGVPPVLTTPIRVMTGDISNSGARARQISYMVLFFFVLAPFYSSLGVAIDTTAGERERLSLQSLLAQPVSPTNLILGKWLIAATFGTVGTLITVFGGIYALGFAPLDVIGIRLDLGLDAQISLVLTLIPLAFLVAAVQILISLTAKSYKEANTYLQLLVIVPSMTGMFFMFGGKTIEGLAAYIPILSHFQGMEGVLIGGVFDPLTAFLNAIVAISLAVLCLWFAAKKLKSEAILSAA